MRIVLEGFLDVLHVGSTTGKDDAAQKLVAILLGNLTPHIGYDFLQTAFHDFNELTGFYLAVLVDGILHIVVDITVFGIG